MQQAGTLDIYESNEELRITIDHLNNYPIISEDDLSEQEMEKTEEAWDLWARHDVYCVECSKNYITDDIHQFSQ